ncbi:MAG: right-handed parallel beta-helix repeat-containing protein [Steroidobacteraceae bacterium]
MNCDKQKNRHRQFIRTLGVLLLALAAWAPRAQAQTSCDVASFGFTASAEDNTAALGRVLAGCAGREILFPAGTFVFRPSGYAQGLTVPTGTTLQGAGSVSQAQTVFQIADSGTFASLLWIRNDSHIAIRDIRFEGSHYDSGCSRRLDYGHAIYIESDKNAPASVEDISITGNVLHNFNGMSWVTVNAQDGSPGIGHSSLIAISKNAFVSDSALVGGCAALGINYSVAMISLHGSDESNQGIVENVSIASNAFDAGYVKQAVSIWSGTSRISVQYNTIREAGARLAAASGELGRYAINIYNSAHEKPGLHPSDIKVVGNTIENPVSCGVYVAGGRKIEISRNHISGQSDPYDVTLPKGGIALNHAEDSSVTDNDLRNNHIGITVVVGTVSVQGNSVAPAANGIRTKIWQSDHAPPQIQR